MNDCIIGKYHITTGMDIQVNVIGLHMNRDLWGPENPKEFHPERFVPFCLLALIVVFL